MRVTNASEPEFCAERDNITLTLTSKDVRSFRIEAVHPAYLNTLSRDHVEADWSGCGAAGPSPRASASAPVAPKRTTLYEAIDMWVVGLTFPTFWRAARATVRVGDRVERGLHLVQVWMIRPMGGEEVLVFYPQDGYWRLRPLAPTGRAPTAFGSSFLIGPVELSERPIVNIDDVLFDPATRSFSLSFARGGTGLVRISSIDQLHHVLEVSFDKPVEGRPFAAVRSMYVTDANNDAQRIAVSEPGAKGWREDGVMTFKGAQATDIWVGRLTPSRHNTSSPDLVLNAFSGTPSTPPGDKR